MKDFYILKKDNDIGTCPSIDDIQSYIDEGFEYICTTNSMPVNDPNLDGDMWDISAAKICRDTLLTSSDWTQVTDNALSDSDKALWRTYRQALRDLPNHADWPNMDWPTKP